jgi:HD superfamily phosphodiesterase
VIIPAALFYDLVVYPKNHPDKHKSQELSAEGAGKILERMHTKTAKNIAIRRTNFLKTFVQYVNISVNTLGYR